MFPDTVSEFIAYMEHNGWTTADVVALNTFRSKGFTAGETAHHMLVARRTGSRYEVILMMAMLFKSRNNMADLAKNLRRMH